MTGDLFEKPTGYYIPNRSGKDVTVFTPDIEEGTVLDVMSEECARCKGYVSEPEWQQYLYGPDEEGAYRACSDDFEVEISFDGKDWHNEITFIGAASYEWMCPACDPTFDDAIDYIDDVIAGLSQLSEEIRRMKYAALEEETE